MQRFKGIKTRARALWPWERLTKSVVLITAVIIAIFAGEWILVNSLWGNGPQGQKNVFLWELWLAVAVVTVVALLAVPTINGVLDALRYRSRLDIMVRQSLLFTAGLVLAVLLVLTWTPIPRLLGIEGMGAWQKLLTAGGVITLTAAIVGLVISYRKQRDTEDDKFNRDFATAASQLGDVSPAVRIAGVYAMAALADNNFLRRQRCIDVLCGHLRIPYNPVPTQNDMSSQTIENKKGTSTRTQTFVYSPGEREVRESIMRVIRDRLQPQTADSWAGCDFDFSGAIFDGFSLGGADFSAGQVIFDRARFVDGSFDFSDVVFSGGSVSFELTHFENANVIFDYARFEAGNISFSSSAFTHSTVSFASTTFVNGDFDFGGAKLAESTEITFLSSIFDGASVAFDNVSLVGSVLRFDEAEFASGTVRLDFIRLQDARVSLDLSKLSNTQNVEVSLLSPEIINGRIHRNGKDFHGYRWPPYGT